MAQFQAFKVYEDNVDKLDNNRKFNNDKHVFNDVQKRIDKIEVQEMSVKCNLEESLIDSPNENIPMSVTKDEELYLIDSPIVKSKTTRDTFFEMPEYRDEIFLYLKEQEVSNKTECFFNLPLTCFLL